MGRRLRRHALPAVVMALIVPAASPSATGAAGDVERGRREFLRCAICHAAEPNVHKSGPSLADVYGRKAGTVESFTQYSKALKESGIVWTDENLDAWLQGPKAFIPGNSMTMRGIKDAQVRRDIIAYLEALAARNAAAADSAAQSQQMVERPAGMPDLSDLKALGPEQQVSATRSRGDTYHVSTARGAVWNFWEFNLRFKTDFEWQGPSGAPPGAAARQDDRRPGLCHFRLSRGDQRIHRASLLSGTERPPAML